MKAVPFGRTLSLAVAALAGLNSLHAQELLLQEGFNTDGEAATPKRYTMTGRDLYEPQRIRDVIGNFDQKGPIYWEHSFNVSYAGNPTITGRRAMFTWRGTDAAGGTEDLLKLFDSTVNWLLAGKKNAQIVVNPNAAAVQGLADRLTAAGHTVVDDDTTANPNDFDVAGDLFIHGPGANNASRFVLRTQPVIVINAPDYDDMLVGSIGTSVTFDPGQVTITAAGHPAAGGKTGTFAAFNPGQTFELVGTFLPTNSTTVATVTRIVPPAVSSLADVDAMVAGTKAHDMTAGKIAALDFSDGSVGQWSYDNGLPGGYTGNWGLVIAGKINVAAAGTYRFALGSDDGARLQIDRDKNGFTDADTIREDAGPHAHQIVYDDVTFAAAGTYDLQVRSYNSGGGGSVEISVAVQAGTIPDDDLASGYWEVLGADGASSPVKLVGEADVTGYVAVGPNVERQEPLIVVSNGPNDTPPGAFYDGGPFAGFEGTGFLGGAGLNKWDGGVYPDGQGYRFVRLNPVNVTGKTNVHLTVALAGTVVDFEDSDLLDIVVYPNGANSTPVILAHFRGVQNAIQPWLADQKQNYQRRLTRQFADFTYDVPPTATDLIIEIRAATTWWTEIVAIDNIRLTAGAASGPPTLGTPKLSGSDVQLTWTGGQAPYLVQWTSALGSPWINLQTTSATATSIPLVGTGGFFRVQSGATGAAVKLYKATLSGAAEVPAVDSPATGAALLAVEGDTLTYFVSYAGLKQAATMAHIHGPAPATTTAGVLIGFTAVGGLGTTGVFSGTSPLTAVQKGHIEAGQTYVNVHSGAHGSGEIRGQISLVP